MNSGIYILYNIYTGRKYVGSSRNLKHRKVSHFSGMKNGTHENYKVQKEYDAYGIVGFRWEILEVCDVEDLIVREQYWLDSIKPELNILLTADNHYCDTHTEVYKEGRRKQAEKMRGRKVSDETKRRMSQSHRIHWADPKNREKLKRTPAQRKHLSEINMGEKNPNWGLKRTPEQLENLSRGRANTRYVYLSPDGKEVEIVNMQKNGARITGVSSSTLRKLKRGVIKEFHGWKFLRVEKSNSS